MAEHRQSRYTLFLYDAEAACVDCETCDCKVTNLHGHTREEVLARIVAHDDRCHQGARS